MHGLHYIFMGSTDIKILFLEIDVNFLTNFLEKQFWNFKLSIEFTNQN